MEFSIGEAARQAGIRPSALRYYESIGLLPAPKRINGRRRYDESLLQRIALLQLAQKAGFSMAEIETLFHGFTPDTPPAARWRKLAAEKMNELDALIERAQQMKQFLTGGLRCNCLQLDDCVINWNSECNQSQCDR